MVERAGGGDFHSRLVESAARVIGLLQRGRIATYLLYSFVTLLLMLFWVRR